MQTTKLYLPLTLFLCASGILLGGIALYSQQMSKTPIISSIPKDANSPPPVGEWNFNGSGVNSVAGPSMTAVGSAFFTSTGGVDGNGYGETTTGNDSFQVNDYSGIDLPQNFTIEFWYRQATSNSPTTQNLVSKGTSPNSYNYWVFVDGQGNVKSGYTGFSTAYWHQTSNGNSPLYNYWHYIVFEKNSTMEWYYIDAKLWDSEAYTENALNISTPLVIGGSSPTTGPRVDFDLLKIFNYTRTQSDVISTYEQYMPLASFNYTLNTAVPNENVIFTDTSSGGVSPYTYLWQFGTWQYLN